MSSLKYDMLCASKREDLIDKYNLRHKCDCGATTIFNIKDEYRICRCCRKTLFKDKKQNSNIYFQISYINDIIILEV